VEPWRGTSQAGAETLCKLHIRRQRTVSSGIYGLKALLIAEAALKSASKHRKIELREIIDERFIPPPSAGHTKFKVYTGF